MVPIGGVLYFWFFEMESFLHPLFTVESFTIPFYNYNTKNNRGRPQDSTTGHRMGQQNKFVLGVYGEGGAGKAETASQNECCM